MKVMYCVCQSNVLYMPVPINAGLSAVLRFSWFLLALRRISSARYRLPITKFLATCRVIGILCVCACVLAKSLHLNVGKVTSNVAQRPPYTYLLFLTDKNSYGLDSLDGFSISTPTLRRKHIGPVKNISFYYCTCHIQLVTVC